MPIAAEAGETIAIAILCCKVGEKVPEVTRPTSRSPESTERALPGDPLARREPGRRGSGPGAPCVSSRARDRRNPPCSSLTAQPRPAENGSISSASSWPYSGIAASSRRVSRAPRPQARSRAACPTPAGPPRSRRPPSRRRSPRSRPRPCSRPADHRVDAVQQPAHRQMIVLHRSQGLIEERLERLTAWGPWTAIIAVSSVRSAKLPSAAGLMRLELLDDARPIRRVADNQVGKRLTINQDIVDHPAPVVGHQAILDLSIGEARRPDSS